MIWYDTQEEKLNGRMNVPKKIIDAHHHFIDTSAGNNDLINKMAGELIYHPCDYERDVMVALKRELDVDLIGSVHVEAIPNNGAEEVRWAEQLLTDQSLMNNNLSFVKGYVGSVDLASDTAEKDMIELVHVTPKVKGVRWILDCVGPYGDGNTATHVATIRHDGIDYLRHGENGSTMKEFERGYQLLQNYNLSFDLQCAPAQLLKAAELAAKYPNIPLVIDHLGKPRKIVDYDNFNSTLDTIEEIKVWREGMKAMAKIPHVYVKLSMLGYIAPGWIVDTEKEKLLKSLVLEVVNLFGPSRCMMAFNWFKNGALSDSDGFSDVGPDAVTYCRKLTSWLSDDDDDDDNNYNETDLEWIFSKTAQSFYRLSN